MTPKVANVNIQVKMIQAVSSLQGITKLVQSREGVAVDVVFNTFEM